QRPAEPVYAFTSNKAIYNRQSILWGVTPKYIPDIKDAQRLIAGSENLLLEKNLVAKGDRIVLVIGMGLKEGSTNVIKIHRVGYED
nr:pyruvate kinase alpha/beta domain-containing protein [Desulfobacterales bacterium]